MVAKRKAKEYALEWLPSIEGRVLSNADRSSSVLMANVRAERMEVGLQRLTIECARRADRWWHRRQHMRTKTLWRGRVPRHSHFERFRQMDGCRGCIPGS